MENLRHRYIQINGMQMHYVTAGSGPLLLLLHGFPEYWYSWRHQIAAFSAQFTVVAPDLRGYNDTDKPDWGYEVDVLVHDVLELIRALGYEQAIVAGHDWGGGLAWVLAIKYPQRVRRLIVLNLPHPACFQEAMRTSRQQRRRSGYIWFFQLPWLPEALIRARDYAAIELALRRSTVQPDTFSDDDIQRYKDAISKPGALAAALNWYRAMGRSSSYLLHHSMQVDVPTLLIWGEQDAFLGIETTHGTDQYVPHLQVRSIAHSGHWVQQEQPALVNQYMHDFLADLSDAIPQERQVHI